eukprot:gnl/MRDRNA2_/MRDRNA2_74807_c0_seq1.p1 gnl/MRDRNA2_/MRDRNA2_74807_c0~~gnl/MRDRNA2_/MRDRNA2_74807_c0_seq1.p1  ORF type:complete len:222 (+),score=67.08 gnl/MRDRNA2_/MRDRNA2_74807_c0_seq1:128-793(+)
MQVERDPDFALNQPLMQGEGPSSGRCRKNVLMIPVLISCISAALLSRVKSDREDRQHAQGAGLQDGIIDMSSKADFAHQDDFAEDPKRAAEAELEAALGVDVSYHSSEWHAARAEQLLTPTETLTVAEIKEKAGIVDHDKELEMEQEALMIYQKQAEKDRMNFNGGKKRKKDLWLKDSAPSKKKSEKKKDKEKHRKKKKASSRRRNRSSASSSSSSSSGSR